MEREDNAEDHQTSQEEEGFPDGEDSAEDEIYYQNSQEVERVRLESYDVVPGLYPLEHFRSKAQQLLIRFADIEAEVRDAKNKLQEIIGGSPQSSPTQGQQREISRLQKCVETLEHEREEVKKALLKCIKDVEDIRVIAVSADRKSNAALSEIKEVRKSASDREAWIRAIETKLEDRIQRQEKEISKLKQAQDEHHQIIQRIDGLLPPITKPPHSDTLNVGTERPQAGSQFRKHTISSSTKIRHQPSSHSSSQNADKQKNSRTAFKPSLPPVGKGKRVNIAKLTRNRTSRHKIPPNVPTQLPSIETSKTDNTAKQTGSRYSKHRKPLYQPIPGNKQTPTWK